MNLMLNFDETWAGAGKTKKSAVAKERKAQLAGAKKLKLWYSNVSHTLFTHILSQIVNVFALHGCFVPVSKKIEELGFTKLHEVLTGEGSDLSFVEKYSITDPKLEVPAFCNIPGVIAMVIILLESSAYDVAQAKLQLGLKHWKKFVTNEYCELLDNADLAKLHPSMRLSSNQADIHRDFRQLSDLITYLVGGGCLVDLVDRAGQAGGAVPCTLLLKSTWKFLNDVLEHSTVPATTLIDGIVQDGVLPDDFLAHLGLNGGDSLPVDGQGPMEDNQANGVDAAGTAVSEDGGTPVGGSAAMEQDGQECDGSNPDPFSEEELERLGEDTATQSSEQQSVLESTGEEHEKQSGDGVDGEILHNDTTPHLENTERDSDKVQEGVPHLASCERSAGGTVFKVGVTENVQDESTEELVAGAASGSGKPMDEVPCSNPLGSRSGDEAELALAIVTGNNNYEAGKGWPGQAAPASVSPVNSEPFFAFVGGRTVLPHGAGDLTMEKEHIHGVLMRIFGLLVVSKLQEANTLDDMSLSHSGTLAGVGDLWKGTRFASFAVAAIDNLEKELDEFVQLHLQEKDPVDSLFGKEFDDHQTQFKAKTTGLASGTSLQGGEEDQQPTDLCLHGGENDRSQSTDREEGSGNGTSNDDLSPSSHQSNWTGAGESPWSQLSSRSASSMGETSIQVACYDNKGDASQLAIGSDAWWNGMDTSAKEEWMQKTRRFGRRWFGEPKKGCQPYSTGNTAITKMRKKYGSLTDAEKKRKQSKPEVDALAKKVQKECFEGCVRLDDVKRYLVQRSSALDTVKRWKRMYYTMGSFNPNKPPRVSMEGTPVGTPLAAETSVTAFAVSMASSVGKRRDAEVPNSTDVCQESSYKKACQKKSPFKDGAAWHPNSQDMGDGVSAAAEEQGGKALF